jgi:hypothetical protein
VIDGKMDNCGLIKEEWLWCYGFVKKLWVYIFLGLYGVLYEVLSFVFILRKE